MQDYAGRRIEIQDVVGAGSYGWVSADRADEVVATLMDAGISCWRETGSLSLDEKPHVTVVNLSRNILPLERQAAQNLLDRME